MRTEHEVADDQGSENQKRGRGCLIFVSIAGVIGLLLVSGLVYVLLTAEPSEAGFTADYVDCGDAEVAHLSKIYNSVREDADKLYEFDGLNRLSGSRQLEVRRKLMKIWPLTITCRVSNKACPYGANTRGHIVTGSANIQMCAFTTPNSSFCDTYAGIAYAQGYAFGLRESEAAGYFDYARRLCESGNSN